jgi:hypothetical protein
MLQPNPLSLTRLSLLQWGANFALAALSVMLAPTLGPRTFAAVQHLSSVGANPTSLARFANVSSATVYTHGVPASRTRLFIFLWLDSSCLIPNIFPSLSQFIQARPFQCWRRNIHLISWNFVSCASRLITLRNTHFLGISCIYWVEQLFQRGPKVSWLSVQLGWL